MVIDFSELNLKVSKPIVTNQLTGKNVPHSN